jgi:hypothetical protein
MRWISTPTLAALLSLTVSAACENEVDIQGQSAPDRAPPSQNEDGPPAVTPPDNPPPDTPDGQCLAGTNKVIPGNAGAVYFGTRQPTHVPLEPDQILAVVGIGFGSPYDASCSGTLITEDIVLTAKHCTEGEPGGSMYALFGTDDMSPVLAVRSVAKREHPDHDMAMLQLESSPLAQLNVRPIPVDRGSLSFNDEGTTFEQAGYGQTETGSSNGRFFVAEPLDGFENGGRELVVNGEGQHGVCFGDSGGPSMRITDEGVRVVGALSWGDPNCVGRDRYARVDYALDWIEEWTGPTPGADQGVPCGNITDIGRCDAQGTTATFCDGGQLVNDPCGAGFACGFDEATLGGAWRCLEAAADPCGGVTLFGQCDGGTLSWCDSGEVQIRNCGACGETCGLVDNTLGFACLDGSEPPSTDQNPPTAGGDCGDIDYTGACDGDTALWCDGGVLNTRDCANQGQVCGYVNDNIGFFCEDQPQQQTPGCGDLDYTGECAGDVARWCENEEVREVDCGALNQTCGFVSDSTGYYCQ